MTSNLGVFTFQGNQFSIIPDTEGQASNISKIDNKLIIGHSEGTFLYEKGIFSMLNDMNGGWNLAKSNINNSYRQAIYSGVINYNDVDNLNQKSNSQ